MCNFRFSNIAGYGNLVPVTMQGRIICIFFGLFGVPLMLVTIADMGKFISDGIVWCYHKYRRLKLRLRQRHQQLMRQSSLSRAKLTKQEELPGDLSVDASAVLDDDDEEHPIPVTIVLLIIVGYTALGGLLLKVWEVKWTFFESFYFAFITMVGNEC